MKRRRRLGTDKGTSKRLSIDFAAETLQARRNGIIYSKYNKKKPVTQK